MVGALDQGSALVTGASRRLGLAIARALAQKGFAVALHASQRSRAEAELACADLRAAGGRACVLSADLADPVAVAGLVAGGCDAGGTGAGVSSGGDAGYDGEGDPPHLGYYEGPSVQFRLMAGGVITDFDFQLACTCDGMPHDLDGRIREGGALADDGVSLVPVVNRAAGLRIDGAFVSSTEVAGTSSNACCTDVPWQARHIEEGEVPGGLCTGQPQASPVPVGATESGATLHWKDPATCIGLSASPALAGMSDRIIAAARQWDGLSCSALCFDPLTTADAGPVDAADRRLHFAPEDAAHVVPAGSRALTSVRARPLDGEITGATIYVSDAVVAETTLVELLRQIGRALGYDQAPDALDSVLGAAHVGETLTVNDEAALCALYGDPPYCLE